MMMPDFYGEQGCVVDGVRSFSDKHDRELGTVHDLAPNKHDVDEQGRDEVIPLDKVGQAYL